ncbi:MAG: hypothetical protein KDE68_01595 [Rhodocyclaceae bacterium]|nr:hypothetical protein [Rhodocyclaceae bacterium]
MSGFENYQREAADIERALLIQMTALGIEWTDEAAVAALAREALGSSPSQVQALLRDPDRRLRAKGEMFALSVLMLRLMAESATVGVHTHGGPAWKAFGSALLRAGGGDGAQ